MTSPDLRPSPCYSRVQMETSMTPRQIRRAAERKATKQARKQARTAANRSNSQSSTGPRTSTGKAISSQNALKTALTGRTVLLPADDRTRYEAHLTDYFRRFDPVSEHECALVQSLADTWWRLLRIPSLEAALYAKGRAEFVEPDPVMVQLETYLKYEKQFRNLALQERRLASHAKFLLAELARVQFERAETEQLQPHADELPLHSRSHGGNSGFVFSNELSPLEFAELPRLAAAPGQPAGPGEGA